MAKKVDWYYHRSGWTGCTKASKFVEARKIPVTEKVSASRKLGRDDAAELAASATRVIVSKGKKVQEFAGGGGDVVDAMLGSTGNLRAPLLRVGKTLLVGFNEEAFKTVLG